MPGLWEMIFGSKDRNIQQPTLTPGQNQGLEGILRQMQQMMGQGGAYSGANDYLQKILSGDPGAMAEFEAPYRQQFESQTIPGIAERFAGLNPMGGGLSSSGFGQALGGAGAQLQTNLAGLHGALKQGASGQAMGQFNNLAGMGLGTRAFENQYQPGSTGLLGGGLQGLFSGAGQGFGLGGGNALMQLIQRLFGGGGGNQPRVG